MNAPAALNPGANTNAGDQFRLARHVMAGRMYRQLHEALNEAGIDHLVLKGPHLASMYYERPWQRGYNDIDLLVRPADFKSALAVLVRLGYSPKSGPAGRKASHAAVYDYPMRSREGSVVELHRDLSGHGKYPVDSEGMFRRAVDFDFEQTPAKGLAAEDLLVHLVIHAAKSQLMGIERKHLEDIRVLLENASLDWEAFSARAMAAGCRNAAWFFLRAAANLEKAPVPAGPMAALAPGPVRRAWAGLWLDLEEFPLLRPHGRVKAIRWLLVAPVLVDRQRQLILAAARYLQTRLADQWLRFKHRTPGT